MVSLKKSKSKKNWFKVKFEKHPYLYTFVIGWPILWYIIILIDDNSTVYVEVLLITFFAFPIIIFSLWFRKNKSKIKPFYKRNKKIFNRVYFYLGSVFSLIPIACLIGIIATGGVNNFLERTKFEIKAAIWTYNTYDLCSSPSIMTYTGFPKAYRLFLFKEGTQYIDYFENKFPFLILEDKELLNVNHCTGTRFLLKEAQKGKYEKDREVAKEILVAYPPELRDLYSFPFNLGKKNNKYIFSRYEKNIANMDLDNPAIAYSYAVNLDKNIDRSWYADEIKFPIKPEALKYLRQSAEDGYFISMMTWLLIYSAENNFNKKNCDTYLKYTNILADNNSLIPYFNLIQGYMGKIGNRQSKTIFKCLNNKPNFSKSFSMLTKRPTAGSTYQSKKSHSFNSSYPAIYYLYGLGDVKQDYVKAYELFSYREVIGDNLPSHAYIAYMNFMGMGVERNPNKGIGLTIELVKSISVDESSQQPTIPIGMELLCGGNSYNFIIPDLLVLEPYWGENVKKLTKSEKEKKRSKYEADEKTNEKIIKEYRDKIGQCLLESEHEVSIKFLKDYIYNRMNDWFKNPELVKTLNYLGEPK